jgi:uncharacterized lipoprotein
MFTFSGCSPAPIQPQRTPLEIQAIQSKSFEANKKVTFNAVMSVLQDLGYIVGSASLETGFITAESPLKHDDSSSAMFQYYILGTSTQNKTFVTVSIEEITAKTTKVRLNFLIKTTLTKYSPITRDDIQVTDPKAYEIAFDKIGEAIFVRTAQK